MIGSPYEYSIITMAAGILVSASILSLYLVGGQYAWANGQ
ncbi:hypothetical protein SAMN04488556_3765 [Halostagnicola kamekurae]|uniref:Uncharacterized protein n=1 Tax=Halostagnicola kamekurae TaxID=619731 RepID=A0A1I6UD15_9EURY|nr:hypothetical protein SAMN04488556_3765 [Halostagnicola kamekurae]